MSLYFVIKIHSNERGKWSQNHVFHFSATQNLKSEINRMIKIIFDKFFTKNTKNSKRRSLGIISNFFEISFYIYS